MKKGEIGTIVVMAVLVLVSIIGLGSSKFLEKKRTVNTQAAGRICDVDKNPVEKCGSGNVWDCTTANGCTSISSQICPEQSLEFNCCVADMYQASDASYRIRRYGCGGQPCQNTIINNSIGHLVGCSGKSSGQWGLNAVKTAVDPDKPGESSVGCGSGGAYSCTLPEVDRTACPTPYLEYNCCIKTTGGCSNGEDRYRSYGCGGQPCANISGITLVACPSGVGPAAPDSCLVPTATLTPTPTIPGVSFTMVSNPATGITDTSAVLHGYVNDYSNVNHKKYQFNWVIKGGMVYGESELTTLTSNNFSYTATNLNPDTTYSWDLCIYDNSGGNKNCSTKREFTTLSAPVQPGEQTDPSGSTDTATPDTGSADNGTTVNISSCFPNKGRVYIEGTRYYAEENASSDVRCSEDMKLSVGNAIKVFRKCPLNADDTNCRYECYYNDILTNCVFDENYVEDTFIIVNNKSVPITIYKLLFDGEKGKAFIIDENNPSEYITLKSGQIQVYHLSTLDRTKNIFCNSASIWKVYMTTSIKYTTEQGEEFFQNVNDAESCAGGIAMIRKISD